LLHYPPCGMSKPLPGSNNESRQQLNTVTGKNCGPDVFIQYWFHPSL
jgi:hypothetical protein